MGITIQNLASTGADSPAAPITASDGNLLILFVSTFVSTTHVQTPAGWTVKTSSEALSNRPIIFVKKSDGTEGATVTLTKGGTNFNIACKSYSITPDLWSGNINDVDVSAWVSQNVDAGIDSVDPGVITASWGAQAGNIFISSAYAAKANNPFTVTPTGYTSETLSSGTDANGDSAHIAVGYKIANIASDDPSAYTCAVNMRMESVGLVVKGPAANQDPVLDTPETDYSEIYGWTGTIDVGENFSDANPGDTLTFSDDNNFAANAGVTFNSVTGVFTLDGTLAQGTYNVAVTASDGNGGTYPQDTFTVEITAPVLIVNSVSDTTPQPGDQIDITHSNALDDLTAGDYTVVSNAPGTTRVLIPNPITFVLTGQTYPTLNFNTPVNIPLTDGTNSDDAALDGIEPPTGTEFAEITSIPANSIYAATPAIQVGHFGHFFNITGNWVIDAATGVVIVDASGGSFDYTVYNGEWAAPVTHTVAARPSGTVTIDSLVPGREGAVVNFSYPGSDLTGFQYRIDGGSWQAATSPLNIIGQSADTEYTLDLAAVNNGRIGDITTAVYTTQEAVDTSPNTFTFAAQSGVARGVYVTSNAITVQGVDAGVDIPVTVSGGEYSVSTDNGQTWGVFTATPTNVRLNYQIRVRHMSASGYNAQRTTGLNVGDKVGYFISTTLVDAVAPVISLTGGNMSIVQGTAFVEPGYSAIDNADGDISVSGVVVTGSVNTNVPGTYTLTYTATDAAGNSASTTRIVTVTPFVPADTQAPVISLVGGNITLNEGDTWSEPGYSATDNVDGNITNSVTVSGSVNTSVPGTYTLTYSATDAAGNTGSVSRTVTVLAAVQYPTNFSAPSSRTFVAERINRIEKGEAVFIKQVDEILDYDFDLSAWLASQSDSLPNGNFSVSVSSSDLKVVGSGIVTGTSRVKAWLSGGKAETYGTSYAVELTIITASFRKAQFLIRLVVIDRVQ